MAELSKEAQSRIAAGALTFTVLGTFMGLRIRQDNLNFEQVVSTPSIHQNYGVKITTHVKKGEFELLELESKQGGKYIICIFERSNTRNSKIPHSTNSMKITLDFDPGETLTLDKSEIGSEWNEYRVGSIQFADIEIQKNKDPGVFFF